MECGCFAAVHVVIDVVVMVGMFDCCMATDCFGELFEFVGRFVIVEMSDAFTVNMVFDMVVCRSNTRAGCDLLCVCWVC